MSREATKFLVESGVKIIGIDCYSLDRPFMAMVKQYYRTNDKKCLWPAHFYGREKEYCHIERLTNLDKIPMNYGFKFCCFPIKLKEIDYINAHGSGTKQNDINETGAYKKVFGELAYKIPMSSTKSMTGHPLGAASAVEAIVCCLALENNFMPPTINYNKKDALCDLDYIPNCGREKNLNVVLTNASGFGGLHAAMILKKYID